MHTDKCNCLRSKIRNALRTFGIDVLNH